MVEENNVAHLTYELLKRMSARFDRYEIEQVDLKLRLSAIEDHLGGAVLSLAGVNSRIDRLDERLGRIERRLDLVDAH